MVPEYGCEWVSVGPFPPTLCHVIVAVPDPVGNPVVVAHPDKPNVTSAMPITPDHRTTGNAVFEAGPKRLRSWIGDIR